MVWELLENDEVTLIMWFPFSDFPSDTNLKGLVITAFYFSGVVDGA